MKKQSPSFQHRRTLVSVAVAMALTHYGAALAAPVGQQVVSGQVTVTRPDALQTVISQGSQAAIVNWQQFSIGAAEHVDIRQPNASSVLLNRVIGNNPSEIYGRLSANGQVFLVNPNGVLFGRNAQVSVGGLVASTLDIANDDFLAGRYQFQGAGGAVDNFGTLQAADRGTVALLGGRVNNDGTISARLGTAALAAGEKITLDFEGDGLTKIRVDQGAVAALVANRGLIVADGGQAVMTAGAAQALADTVLNQQGVLRARSLVERDGKIVLDGGAHGLTLNSGTLDATGAAGLKGGVVTVLGHHVGLVGNAVLDASGDAGGGQVYVGGGVQGANPLLRNAAGVFAAPQTSVRADALGMGHGGTVVLWSDGATRMFGAASAAGGARGGDGGFIETSGKFLDVAGARISAAGPRGKAGTWLLDPHDIDIVASDPGLQMPTAPNFVSDGSVSQLWNQAIINQLEAGTSVTVTTGAGSATELGNIWVSADIVKNAGGDARLTLNAANDILISSGIKIGSTVGALAMDFNADSDNLLGGTITVGPLAMIESNGGDVRLYGQSDPVAGFATAYDFDASYQGVRIDAGATIDTTSGAADGGSGAIVIRGRGYREAQGGGEGVLIDSANLLTGSGAISIVGIGGEGTAGVGVLSASIATTNGGSIDIRGLTIPDQINNIYGNGILVDDSSISTLGAGGNILLSGESVAAAGVSLGGTTLGSAGMSGDIVVRAYNVDLGLATAAMLDLPSSVETQGIFAMLPGGVSANGDLVGHDGVTINLGNFFTAAPPPGEFTIDEPILDLVVGPSVYAVVLGSDTHTGLIKVTTPASSGSTYDLTLQNGGAGSAGISLQSDLDMTGRKLMLASGGAVTQAGAITADELLLFGMQPEASFTLTNSGNSVGTLAAFSVAGVGSGALDGDVRFVNNGGLQIGSATAAGLASAGNLSTLTFAPNASVTGDLDIQTTGALTLASSVLMSGPGSTLALRSDNDIVVNGGIYLNNSNIVAGLTATRDILVNGPLSAIGANPLFTANAGRNVGLNGSLTTLGADATFAFNAGAAAALGGAVDMQGAGASLAVYGVTGLTHAGNIDMSGADAVLRLSTEINLTSTGSIALSGANGDLALDTVIGNVNVSGPVSMTGSNALLSFSAGLDVLLSGSVSTAGGANVHSVNANRNILLGAGAAFFANPASAPFNLDFNADADNLNGGVFGMSGGASIDTNGGALRVYGQSDAAAGYATGESQFNPDGISLSNASIHTGSGALTLRGRGATFFSTGPTPVFFGAGVRLGQAALLATSGAISVTGMGGQGADGIALASSDIVTNGGGAIDLRGRSGAILSGTPNLVGAGVTAADSLITTGGAASNVVISGESAGGSGIALSGANALGGSGMSGNVVLRAFNTASSAAMLSLGGTIETGGAINLRPGGVSAAAVLTEQPATVINLGGALAAGQFNLSPVALDAAILPGSAGVVIGGAAHSGAILAPSGAPLSGLFDLSLQNDAPGSGGISLGTLALPGAQLTLSSGGAVTQSGPLVAGALLLRGTQPQSRFILNNTGNAVGTVSVAFLQPKGSGALDGDLDLYSSTDLLLGSLSGIGFDGATNQAQVISAAGSVVAGDLTLASGGDLTLAADISMLAPDATLALSAGRDITLGGAIGMPSASGALQVNVNADADGVNGGAIVMAPGASIVTNGGSVNLYGQSDAVAGFASGSVNNLDGVTLAGTINTEGSGGAGAISVRGRGLSNAGVSGVGVVINGATLASAGAPILVTGIGGVGGGGLQVNNSSITTSGGGAIDLRGRAGADGATLGPGVLMNNATIRTAGGAGQMAISGEAFGSSGVALIGSNTVGGAGSTGDIVLRAANTSTARTLDISAALQTGGVLNIRPGGVSASGALTEATGTAINIGSAATAGQFSMPEDLFVSGIQAGLPTVIVGSAAHTGAIGMQMTAPLGGSYDLTLQNDGAGSAGITLYNGPSLAGRQLTLSSGGAVTQSGPLVAGNLLLRGTQPQSRFVLGNTGNVFNTLSATFLQPKGAGATDGDVNVYSSTDVQLASLAGIGFDGASGQAQAIGATTATAVAGNLTLGSGGNLVLLQDVSMQAGNTAVNLNAAGSINLTSGTAIGLATPAGTLQVNLNADADGVGGGKIDIGPLASIATNGGNVLLYGQSDAAAGFASGSAALPGDGVAMDGSIDSGAGSVTIRGRGFGGDGVSLVGGSITSTSGALAITGIGGAGGTGVTLSGASQLTTTGGGAIDLRGRSGTDTATAGAGLRIADSAVRTSGGAGAIALSGQAFGASGVALTGANVLGGAATSGNIIIRAANTGSASTLDAGGTLQTTGILNLRPGGVAASGALTEAPATVINIGGTAASGEFSMTQGLFVNGIQAGLPAVIVGSAAQTGAINVLASAPFGGSYDLTLQNDGAGSGGINLYNGLSIPGRMLTLSSGGSVNQGAAIVAGRLLLHGTQAQASFQLANAGNAVNRVSARFEVLKGTAATDGDVNFASSGNLEIGPLTGIGYDGATGLAQSFVAANAVIAGDIVAQAGGNLTLQQNVSTLGSDITLVAGGVLLNPVNATLSPGGGGRWRVFADTWIGEVDGGLTGSAPAPNYYNCLYGAACASLLPATNNYFVYRQQPVLNVVLTTPAQTVVYGTAPAFAFTASGLVNGDTLAGSLAGAYAVPAPANVGNYVVPGAFTSPVGYLVNAAPGSLNVTPATLTYVATPASRPAGVPNPAFSGSVTGFVNGDTLAGATTGTLSFTSKAPTFTAAGQYAIDGSGLTAPNYVFQHAPGNLTALTVTNAVVLMPSIVNNVSLPSSDLYGANFGVQRACVGSGPLAGASGGGDANDTLAMEWARVRETPNLSNCVGLAQRYSCGDF